MSEEDARESENHWIETKLKKRIDLAFTDKPLIAYLICLSHSHNSSNNYFITCVCLFHFYRACSPLVRCSVSIVFFISLQKVIVPQCQLAATAATVRAHKATINWTHQQIKSMLLYFSGYNVKEFLTFAFTPLLHENSIDLKKKILFVF